MTTSPPHDTILRLTVEIITAHLKNNSIANDKLPAAIRSVYQALSDAAEPEALVSMPQPAVPVAKSIFPDYLICLEDGRRLKMLKRHLLKAYGLTPDAYRQRWGLPGDYPMVAPNYSKRRSHLAKQIGLGTQRRHRESGNHLDGIGHRN